MKVQSVFYNYTILLNWEKERTNVQVSFLKLNTPFKTYFGKSPHMDSLPRPPVKTKKTPTLSNKLLRAKDSPKGHNKNWLNTTRSFVWKHVKRILSMQFFFFCNILGKFSVRKFWNWNQSGKFSSSQTIFELNKLSTCESCHH